MALDLRTKSDEEIVALALADSEYFSELMQRYEQPLYRYICRLLTVKAEEAEDILQDTFLQIYEKLNAFDPGLKFSAWAYRITHNLAISYYRRQKNRAQAMAAEDCVILLERWSGEDNVQQEVRNRIKQEQVQEVLKQLEVDSREILILRFLEDMSYDAISDILKLPMGTVATKINRAKAKLKQLLIDNNITPN